MTVPETVEHRHTHEADPDAVEVRQPDEVADEGDLFRIRMPVTSTAEARDGEAFDTDRVRGFQEQLRAERVPLFLDHGRGGPGETRYSQLRKVGYWDAPSIEERNGATDLDADAVLVDPDTLDDDVGDIRAALSWLRAQAEAGLPISASVGWSESTGDRDLPGDADLLEISIVGIPSDPRTTTTADADAAVMARAVAEASTDFDVETFVRELTREQERPFGPPDGDGDEFEDFEDCVQTLMEDDPTLDREDAEAICGSWQNETKDGRAEYEVGDETIDITPPEAMQNAATVALAKADEVDADCGTGVGDQRARQIASDEVGPDVVDEVAAYLTSHEEDVTADGPPSEWSNEEWADCGNLQYAKWGGTGSGDQLAWAQRKANAVAEARGEEVPYPNRAARNLDDPEFAEGDAVEWSSQDTIVRGRVADIGAEFEPADGVVITGDEGEAVYLIHELDDALEPPQYRRENVAKPESSLDESAADLPPLEGNFADEDNDMTNSDTPDDDSGTDRDESDGMDAAEFRESMLEMQRNQTETLNSLAEAIRADGMDDDDEDDDDDDDMDEEASADVDETSGADADTGDVTVTVDKTELTRDEVRDLRAEFDETETEDIEGPETQDRVADDEVNEEADTDSDGPDWRA